VIANVKIGDMVTDDAGLTLHEVTAASDRRFTAGGNAYRKSDGMPVGSCAHCCRPVRIATDFEIEWNAKGALISAIEEANLYDLEVKTLKEIAALVAGVGKAVR